MTRTAALLASWALCAPALAWRTADQLPEFAGAGPVVWAPGPVSFSVIPTAGPTGWSDSAFLNVAGRAADVWTAEACGPSVVSAGATSRAVSGDGVVTIETLRARQWREAGLDVFAAATTDILYERGADGAWRIVDADILVNGIIDWRAPENDLEGALVHELGHALGLLHCCELDGASSSPFCEATPSCAGAVMYPTHLGTEQRRLSSDDRAGLCHLYPSATCVEPGCASCGRDADCGGGEVCLDGECRIRLPAEPECATDDDCPLGRQCFRAACVASERGDPCVEDYECRSGVCDEGSCAERCDTAHPCPSGYECDGARCVSELGAFGDPCASPRDCSSGVCIDGSMSPPVCSRSCDANRACPVGWECARIAARSVCTPAAPAGGCGVSALPTGPPLPAVPSLVLLTLVAASRRRR